MSECDSQYKQFLEFQEFIKKQQLVNQTCSHKKDSDSISSSKLSPTKIPKKRKISSLTHVLVEWINVDPGDLTVLTVNMVLDVSAEKILENSIYNVKFTDKSNGGVYEAKVLAIGTREECVNILEIKIKTKRSQKESLDKINDKSNPMNNTAETVNSLNIQLVGHKAKIIELQAIIDKKNSELEEAAQLTTENVNKYDLLMNSFGKLPRIGLVILIFIDSNFFKTLNVILKQRTQKK